MNNLKTKADAHTPQRIFEIARSCRAYKESLAEARSFEDAPIIDKDMLYASLAMCANDPDFHKGVYVSPTGGTSTRNPLHFPTDIRENHLQRAVMSSYINEAKLLTEESIVLNLFGSTMMYRSAEIFNDYCERAGATVLPVSAHCADDAALFFARKFRANCVVGTVSRLVQFAKYVSETDEQQHEFSDLIFAGESMAPYKQAFIQEHLRAQNISAVFGSAEAGPFGIKPAHLSGAKYLCPSEVVHIELANVDEEGFGTMIVTNLIRTRFPLLRYNTGDVVRLSTQRFGNKEMNMIEFRGREDRSFQLGGEYYLLSEFGELFAGLLEFQIVLSYEQKQKMDKIVFRLVPADQSPDATQMNELAQRLHRMIESDHGLFIAEVEVAGIDQLTKSAHSHKIPRIIDKR